MGFLSNAFGKAPAAAPAPAVNHVPGYENGQGQMMGGYAIPQWLAQMGATELPGGGFGGKNSWRVGNDVYTGTYVDGQPEFGVNGGFVGDIYKYGYNPTAWAGMGSVLNGTPYEKLDQSGKSLGSGTWEGIEDKDYTLSNIATLAVGGILGGIALAPAMAGTGAATAAGGSTAAGTGTALSGAGGFIGEGALSGIGAWDAALANAAAGGAAGVGGAAAGNSIGTGGGFVGEGASSGIGAWDGALANASGASGMGAGAAGSGGGTPPPANPYASGTGGMGGSLQNILNGGGGMNDWLGLATTALGAYGGAQGQDASTSSTRALDPRMDALFYGDLAPRTQGLLAGQMGPATAAGGALTSKGMGLLGQTAPNTPTNPYLQGRADDIQRRTAELLGENNLQIQGNAVATGGLGGSRQGVAQGVAAGRAADYLQGNLAGMYGQAYDQDMGRLRQDWTIGSGLVNQGLQTPFIPAQQTAQVYSPFTGTGTTTNTASSGGGWMGAAGGALGAAQFAKNQGWW
jgi:hypothetical protein